MASQPPSRVEAYLLTDVGRKRPHNEDYVGHFVPDDPQELAANGQLFIVADGVGGAAAGDVASQHAVKKVLHEYFDSDDPDLEQRLVDAIRAANTDLYEYAVSSGKPRMGTTIVAALIRGTDLHIANVGDSRAYLARGQTIHQITQDHSLIDQLLREGTITPEEAREHPPRNVLLRSLGNESKVSIDVFTGQLRSGDVVILCSDGLTRYVTDDEIREAVGQLTGEDACRTLVRMANERGGHDNISIILLHYDPIASGAAPQTSPVTLGSGPKPPDLSGGLKVRSAAASLDDLSGKPRTLSALPEPPSLRERLLGLPWRDIAYGAGALVGGVLVVLAIGFWLPSLQERRREASVSGEAELPATTVSTTGTPAPPETPSPAAETSAGTGEAGQGTAVPETVTPTLAPTLDPALSGPVEIPEGEFIFGATPLQSQEAQALCEQLASGSCLPEYFSDAEPAVQLQLETYYMDRTEVTNGAYKGCVEAGVCAEPEGLASEGLGIVAYYQNIANQNFPVVGVTWNQADAYCRWAGGRLPTEAEWEKAASWVAPTSEKRIWPWGNDWDPSLVNFRNPDQVGGTPEQVNSRPGNVSPYGLLDMAGNVSEWVSDFYAEDYYASLTNGQVNPRGPEFPEDDLRTHVTRGGSWEDNGAFTRTVHRLEAPEDHFNKSIGFRCAYDTNPRPGPGPGAGAADAPPLITDEQNTPTP